MFLSAPLLSKPLPLCPSFLLPLFPSASLPLCPLLPHLPLPPLCGQTWDCIGVMYNRKTGRVRYSLNGRLLQPACHLPGRLFYPAISCDAKTEVLQL